MKRLYLLFLLVPFSATPLLPVEEMPVFLEEIVVRTEAVQKTATVNVVTAEDIKNQGAKTVAEALELVPGLLIRKGGKGEAYARIRGFRQREAAVLIDGIPVSAPYDGQLDLSTLPVEAVERIEIVKGPSSLLYGSNAMGGVINIITKKSDGTVHQFFRGEYGTDENLSLGLRLQGSFGKTRYVFIGQGMDRDSFRLSSDYEEQPNQAEGSRENSDRSEWNGRMGLGWDVGEKGRLSLNLSHMRERFTNMNAMNTDTSVMLATVFMSPMVAASMVKAMMMSIEIHGVLLFP